MPHGLFISFVYLSFSSTSVSICLSVSARILFVYLSAYHIMYMPVSSFAYQLIYESLSARQYVHPWFCRSVCFLCAVTLTIVLIVTIEICRVELPGTLLYAMTILLSERAYNHLSVTAPERLLTWFRSCIYLHSTSFFNFFLKLFTIIPLLTLPLTFLYFLIFSFIISGEENAERDRNQATSSLAI